MMMDNKAKAVLTVDLPDEKASTDFALHLSSCLSPGLIITFSGDLGTGKTTIIRAMLRHLGVQSVIKSPTFSLVETYLCDDFQVHHFDLYRIHHEDELDYLGFRDYFTPESICCIEWAEHAGNSLTNVDVCINLETKGVGRNMRIRALSLVGERILASLIGE